MEKRKLKILKIAVWVFIILVFCTIMSRSISNLLLPVVDTGSVSTGNLNRRYIYSANVEAPDYVVKDSIFAETNLIIEEKYAENGAHVYPGSPLLKVDISDYEKKLEKIDDDIKRLEEKMEQSRLSEEEINILALQVKALEFEKANRIQNPPPEDGIIKADEEGTLLFSANKGEVLQGDVLAEINMAGAKYAEEKLQAYVCLTVELPFKDAELLSQEKDNIKASFNSFDKGEEPVEVDARLIKSEYMAETGLYRLIFISPGSDEMETGMAISLSLDKSIKNQSLIPLSCLSYSSDESNNVFILKKKNGLWGTEYYVLQAEVEVVDSNQLYAAVNLKNSGFSADDLIVINRSSSLDDGDNVRIG